MEHPAKKKKKKEKKRKKKTHWYPRYPEIFTWYPIWDNDKLRKCPLKKIGVHNIPLQKCQNFGVHNFPLQFFWSGQLFTPFIFLVDTCPLQNVGVHVVKVWSAFSLTQKLIKQPSKFKHPKCFLSHHLFTPQQSNYCL
jgi:hypothetical protein